jgi:gas vesicle protein
MKIRSTKRAILYLAAVFLIGLVIGGVAGFAVGLVAKFATPPAHEIEAKIFKDLKEKLKLRTDQENEVKAAVHDVVLDISNALRDVAITSSNAVVRCQQRIDPVLDSAQRATLSNIVHEAVNKAPLQKNP